MDRWYEPLRRSSGTDDVTGSAAVGGGDGGASPAIAAGVPAS
jgi:hypothetical protein